MTETFGNPAFGSGGPVYSGDPLYQEALAHLQAGRWQDAVRCFEELSRRDPGDAAVARMLDEVRFKARLDAGARVRGRRWIIPWRKILVRAAVVAVILFVVVAGVQAMNRSFAPMLAQAQRTQKVATLTKDCKAYADAEKFDLAESRGRELLKIEPDNLEATECLAQVASQREVVALYNQASEAYRAGDFTRALQFYTQVSLKAPGYKDVAQRINEIKRQAEVERLFTEAEADFQAGRFADAGNKYEQVRQLNSNYKRDVVLSRLFDLHVAQGLSIVKRSPPALDEVPQAVEEFSQALVLRPRDSAVSLEHRLGNLYLDGQEAYTEQRWSDAISRLRGVFDLRPDYLGGVYLASLYDAYMRLGDQYRDAKDYALAWVQYSNAASLPLSDTVAARNRLSELAQFITPTPTPAPTNTPTPIPTSTPFDVQGAVAAALPKTPTPRASPTPAAPLSSYRNQIVFFSAKEDQKGMWVMNPDGSNRRYLGDSGELRQQYNDLLKAQTLSPDGRYRVYATSDQSASTQVWIQALEKDQYGNTETHRVTNLAKIAYDPVWSPDGAHIAFVSQDRGSDDVYTIQPDGKEIWNRTPNTWEWDKHPSWSPDSQRIVFWTNREGTKQIYVMDWQGRQQVNISKVAWDEYDPLWIK